MVLEDPMVTGLYSAVALEGDYEKSERLLRELSPHFREYISRQDYTPEWSLLGSSSGSHSVEVR